MKVLQNYLTKNAGKEKEKTFVEMMDDLFDTAYSNASWRMKIELDKKFLILPRQKGRPNDMAV